MKRFKFSLDSVLMLRRKALDDEQRKLALILKTYNKQIEKINGLISDLATIKKESENYLQGNNFNPATISNYAMYANKIQDDIKLQQVISKKTEEVLNGQKQKVKQAYIDVKSLENLYDKQKEQYLKELQLEENKEIDDIVNSRRNIA